MTIQEYMGTAVASRVGEARFSFAELHRTVFASVPEHRRDRGYVITDAIHVIESPVGWHLFCFPTLGVCGEVPHARGILWGATPHSGPHLGSWSPLGATSRI